MRIPTAPIPMTATVSPSPTPASRAAWSAVSTRGNSVAVRGSVAGSRTTSRSSTAKTSWCGWNANTRSPERTRPFDRSTIPTQLYP